MYKISPKPGAGEKKGEIITQLSSYFETYVIFLFLSFPFLLQVFGCVQEVISVICL